MPRYYSPGLPHTLLYPKSKAEINHNTGTGFFIDSDGYLLTARHIIKSTHQIRVLLANGETKSAAWIGSDELSDLALLKIPALHSKPLQFSRQEKVRPGTWVFTLGAPFGFDFSASVGIVSAELRHVAFHTEAAPQALLQTSLPINPGHSGGPVLTLSGKVLGINTQIFTDQASSIGLSFAVPAATAAFVAKSLRQRRQVVRASLDVKIRDSTDTQGAIVTEILPNGIVDQLNQSAKHVIKPNDRLVQLNRFPIRKARES